MQSKVKANSVKQEFEKQDELKRSAMRAIAALLTVPDSGECPGRDTAPTSGSFCIVQHMLML